MKKVSIVVPCYNVAQYLDRCVESLVNQTIGIENLEIILVDDASTDAEGTGGHGSVHDIDRRRKKKRTAAFG